MRCLCKKGVFRCPVHGTVYTERILLKCEKIDHSKIPKLKDIHNEEEWIVAVFSQFGLDSMEKVKAFTKEHGKKIYEYSYWPHEVQDEFEKVIISKLPPSKRHEAERIFDWLNLAWMPRNNKG